MKMFMTGGKSPRYFFIALACGLFISCSGAGGLPVTGWKILYSQDPSLEEIKKKTDWRAIAIPSSFVLPYAQGRGLQHAWLRGDVAVTGDPDEYYGISLGRIYYTGRVFINDIQVGSDTVRDITVMCQARNYIIPKGTLKRGMNSVWVQIGMFGNEYGGLTSPVSLKKEKDFNVTQVATGFLYIYFPLIIMAMAFIVLILLMIFYIWNRNDRIFLYSSFGVLTYIVYLASMFYPFTDISFLFIKFIHLSTIQFFSIALILIIQSLYSIYVTVYNRILIPVLLLFALGNLLAVLFMYRVDSFYTHFTGAMLGIVTVLINVPLAVRLILRLNRMKPDRFNCLLLLFTAVAGGLVILLEVFLSNMRGRFSFVIAMYFAIIMFFLYSIFFAREMMKKNRELYHLYDKLKDEEPVINESSQEKLEKIIQFIKENYTSDISREGLAAAVDMNPNYMSTLFKKYTGFKVNDYINKLRIEEAVKKLTDDDTKIIEIAYSVGFESLTTFNRVFKSTVGKTPTEYRGQA
jgi:AraC-like DNA-binding protein